MINTVAESFRLILAVSISEEFGSIYQSLHNLKFDKQPSESTFVIYEFFVFSTLQISIDWKNQVCLVTNNSVQLNY